MFVTIGYDPITQSVFIGPRRESVMTASFGAKKKGMNTPYQKTFNIGSASEEDYADFFMRCGVPRGESWILVTHVSETILESLKGLPLTHAVYARRLNVL